MVPPAWKADLDSPLTPAEEPFRQTNSAAWTRNIFKIKLPDLLIFTEAIIWDHHLKSLFKIICARSFVFFLLENLEHDITFSNAFITSKTWTDLDLYFLSFRSGIKEKYHNPKFVIDLFRLISMTLKVFFSIKSVFCMFQFVGGFIYMLHRPVIKL